MTFQKEIFKDGEGGDWYQRNRPSLETRDWSHDRVLQRLLSLPIDLFEARVLEIGCGDGSRLAEIKRRGAVPASGVDPSRMAIEKALAQGVEATVGTAEALPFEGASFDIAILRSDDTGSSASAVRTSSSTKSSYSSLVTNLS